ncbi:hypothetical protein C1646_750680 [Rhizophagus diaphanus]|nr:hypothetical protein C1646_750680 [Rhizophagus diaphanus] [Rhizophagus sp. MUCL 43196]
MKGNIKILYILVCLLTNADNSIKILKDTNIIKVKFQKQKLQLNYVKFCHECSSIKRLCPSMLSYPIYKYPGSNISLSNLSELRLVSGLNHNDLYHEFAQICRSIEKIYIELYYDLSGAAELIEMQKQIKYLYVKEYDNNCEKINQALEKHANSIVCFVLIIKTCKLSLHDTLLPKLINLQQLGIVMDNPYSKLKHGILYIIYYVLQTLELLCVLLDIAIDIIQNTNGNLWRIKIRLVGFDQVKEYNQTIHKHCPNIKYVTLFLKDDETLKELENIFIKCQHLVAIDISTDIPVELHDKFLDLLVKSAPLTLYKFHIGNIASFDKKTYKYKEIIELNYYSDDFWDYENIWNNI